MKILTTQIDDKEGGRAKGKKVAIDNKVRLARCWLNISKDVIVGNNQRNVAFWKHVRNLFKNNLPPNEELLQKWLEGRNVKATCSCYAFGFG